MTLMIMNGPILVRLLYNLSVVLIMISATSCKTKQELKKDRRSPAVLELSQSNHDQSLKLQELILNKDTVVLVLGEKSQYLLSDIRFMSNKFIHIKGNSSTVHIPPGKEANSIFTFIDPISLIIEDIIFSGNYSKSRTTDFLLKVHTPSNITDNVCIKNVTFRDCDNGGMAVQNIYPQKQVRNWKSGADSIYIYNCKAYNYGRKAAFFIRGSHRNVVLRSIFISDPYGRQSDMHAIDISAEVKICDDMVGNVLLEGIHCTYLRRELIFGQQISNFLIQGVKMKNLGVDSLGQTYVTNGIKLDDLGHESRAVIRNVVELNSSDLVYGAITLEETPEIGHTANVTLDDLVIENHVILGASGNHRLTNATFYNTELKILSDSNFCEDIRFENDSIERSIYIANTDGNKISYVEFTNGFIDVARGAKNVQIQSCSLRKDLGLEMNHFIGLSMNDPLDPNTIEVYDCQVPEHVLGVWSGGYLENASNVSLTLDSLENPDFPIHKNIKQRSIIRQRSLKEKE